MANYAPLDLVVATTKVRDKVRTIAHPNICMMMPCFRANLPHRSDSAVLDRLDACGPGFEPQGRLGWPARRSGAKFAQQDSRCPACHRASFWGEEAL